MARWKRVSARVRSCSVAACPMSRQAWLISAICSSLRRKAAKAVASGSMMWRNSCTVLQEDLAVGRGRVPGQHVAIEQVPALLGLDPAADLGTRGKQAFGHQHLDGFAHRRAADVEGLGPFGFVGQDGPRRIVAAHDPEADFAGQRPMHARPGNARRISPADHARVLGGSRLGRCFRLVRLPVPHGSTTSGFRKLSSRCSRLGRQAGGDP